MTSQQKAEVLKHVAEAKDRGEKISQVLAHFQVPRSTYYRWLREESRVSEVRSNSMELTPEELSLIDKAKASNPHMRHRQIQGLLQQEGHYLSASSIYQRLKDQGLVEDYERRQAPWKEPFYEIAFANTFWGADWSQLRIGGKRWYLLTLIDFFLASLSIMRSFRRSMLGISSLCTRMDWGTKTYL